MITKVLKKAFTMIELVFVIVVIGIVSSIVVSYAKPNDKGAYDDGSFHQATGRFAEAAVQVMGHIRYTQHLAMIDNKFDINDANWFRKNWQILFEDNSDGNFQYSIFSDADADGVADESEVAVDPSSNEKVLSSNISKSKNSPKLNLYKSYGIESATFSGGCTGANGHISFDQFGRAYFGDIKAVTTTIPGANIIRTTCEIKLCDSGCTNQVTILLEPETGYVHFKTSI